MTCYEPLTIWRVRGERSPNGTSLVYFNPPSKYRLTDLDKLYIPCGKCLGCRLTNSAQWAARLVHEYESSGRVACFVTLTFNDENISPYSRDTRSALPDNSLDKRSFQLFMKRLRAAYPGTVIRFFHCGEYGERFQRPHHHAIIFGINFLDDNDKKLLKFSKKFNTGLYQVPALDALWTYGFASVGTFSFESASYVARYCLKKVNVDNSSFVDELGNTDINRFPDGRLKPYITMSNRPGIGYSYFLKNYKDIFSIGVDSFGNRFLNHRSLKLVNGRSVPIPRYYQKLLSVIDPVRYDDYIDLRSQNVYIPDGFVFDGCSVDLDPLRMASLAVKKALDIKTLIRILDKES